MPSSRRAPGSGSSRASSLTSDEEPPEEARAERRQQSRQTRSKRTREAPGASGNGRAGGAADSPHARQERGTQVARLRPGSAAGGVTQGAGGAIGEAGQGLDEGTSRPAQQEPQATWGVTRKRAAKCPPTFELEVRARARQITFRVVGDVTWRTEGTARVERTGSRDGLPRPVLPHVRYTDVHVSAHVKAWLNESG